MKIREIIKTKVRLVVTSGNDDGGHDCRELKWMPQRYRIML